MTSQYPDSTAEPCFGAPTGRAARAALKGQDMAKQEQALERNTKPVSVQPLFALSKLQQLCYSIQRCSTYKPFIKAQCDHTP